MKFFIASLILIILVVPIGITADSSATVNVNFEVKDTGGNPIQDALVIIQGIGATNTGFSESKLTGSDGKTSFALNQNEFFIYIIYKLSYREQTGGIFTSGNQDIPITMERLPEDQWYFYRVNNGEIEFQFSSPDSDTNYVAGDYINNVLEVRNVGGSNIQLMQDRAVFRVIDGQTENVLRAWGDFIGSGSSELGEITLKANGWIKVTISEETIRVCGGNVIITYEGRTFDLSGNESVCVEEAQDANKIPLWILRNNYKFEIEYFYQVDGQERSIGFISQEFFIDNTGWGPEIISNPTTSLTAGTEWTYDVNIKTDYDETFVDLLNMINYKLVSSPEGMTIDTNTGLVRWTPSQNGDYSIVVRAYHEYFENNTEKIAYLDQEFLLTVTGGQEANSPPTITSTPITGVNETQMYSYQVTATDADGDTLTYGLAGAPWLSIDSSGLVSGTAPLVAEDTNFDIIINVSDGIDLATQTYTLTVLNVVSPPPANNVPVITSTPVTTVNETRAYSYDVEATDSDGDDLTYNMTGPGWLSIDANTGLISGTAPSVDLDTLLDILIFVSDETDIVNQSYALTIINIPPPANNIPVITSTAPSQVNENTLYQYQVTATDADNDTLIYSLTEAPDWLSINADTGLISGTSPEVSSDTNYPIIIDVSDGVDSGSQDYILTVVNTNKIPVITSSAVTNVNENQNYTYQIAATDADGDSLTYIMTGPNWLTIDSSTGLITGTAPSVSADTGENISVSVSDGIATVNQNYILTIKNVKNRINSDSKEKDLMNMVVLPKDSFYEIIYLEQINARKTVFSVPAINVQSSQQNNLQADETTLIDLTTPILISLNLIVIIFITMTLTYRRI